MTEEQLQKDYASYLEKHKYDSLKSFGKIKPMHLAFILLAVIIGLSYYSSSNNKDTTYIIIGVILVVFVMVYLSAAKTNQGISWGEAKAIAYKEIKEDMKDDEDSGFLNGTITFHKGYLVPFPGAYIFNFYITPYETNIPIHYQAKVMKDDGTFGGYHENKGSISGEPPINYGSGKYYEPED